MNLGYWKGRKPQSLPLGTSQPPESKHAVSSSLPTWDSVVRYGNHEKEILKQMQNSYPRFFIHPLIKKLGDGVLTRLHFDKSCTQCMIFPTSPAASRCFKALTGDKSATSTVEKTSFTLLSPFQNLTAEHVRWASFHAVIYDDSLSQDAAAFWRDTGDGITSRHAEFCLGWLGDMVPEANDASFCQETKTVSNSTKGASLIVRSAFSEEVKIRTNIARLANSEKSDHPKVDVSDVFLYATGMSAISTIARTLVASSENSDAVIYGFLYAESTKAIPKSGFKHCSFLRHGSIEELETLEVELDRGRRIQMFFCEVPGNPQLTTCDLHRIRRLADKHRFIVVCDPTVGTFVDVDLLPFVDVLVTSLTKMFSGGSDVMGGSVVLNPASPHHSAVKAGLVVSHENAGFPFDVQKLAQNCVDFESRVPRCNQSALAVAYLLSTHPAIKSLYHPSLEPFKAPYERYRRQNGGYGNLMTIIFHNVRQAEVFYDALDVCKGASFGTNFTLCIPFVQLYPSEEQECYADFGIPKHLVRLSVGLEDELEVLRVVQKALIEVERFNLH